jgi:hypothetical protein
MPSSKTTLVLRDSESTTFTPSIVELPSDVGSRITFNRIARDVSPASKLTATHALALSPEQLAGMGRLFSQKNADKIFAKYAETSNFASCVEVLKYEGNFEVCIRACAARSFLGGVDDVDAMVLNDSSKLRRLPAACLAVLKSKLDEKSLDLSILTPAGRKELKAVLAELPAEDGDVEGAICRIDFSAFAAAPGSKNITSATRLVVSKADLKRKRVAEDDVKSELSTLVKHTRLANGVVALVADGASKITVVGTTILVEYPNTEAAEAVEAAAEDTADA